MPITWKIDPVQKRTLITITDPCAMDDWRNAAQAILDAGFHSDFPVLVDRRAASAPSIEDVERMAWFFETHKSRLTGARGAVVVSDATAYAMSRMLSAYAEFRASCDLQVFHDYAAAEAWLNAGASTA